MNGDQLEKSSSSHIYENYFPSPDEIEMDPKSNFIQGITHLKTILPTEKNSPDVHYLYKGSQTSHPPFPYNLGRFTLFYFFVPKNSKKGDNNFYRFNF